MFSSGLPVLYPIAMVFCLILYWVYKILLLKFYKRTTSFNEQLPMLSIGYIKYGVFFHLFLGSFMYSNSMILTSPSEDTIKDIYSNLQITFLTNRFGSSHS